MIRIDLDVMLARRKMSVTELSARVGITMANCQVGDILIYDPEEKHADE